jgi:multidrug transporter EmrE-like cation transporter
MLRGFLEFTGSTLYLVGLNIALNNYINQGITSGMITLAGIMITVMSWIAYNEVLNIVQMVGICCVLVAVTFMGLF